jgi:hypothetical protein
VVENRMLRRIFGPKRDEVTGGWRKWHNLLFCRCCDEIKGYEMGWTCSVHGTDEECVKIWFKS